MNNSSPHVYGTVAPEIISAVGGMQDRTQELFREIGRLELRKSQILDEVKHLDKQARGLLNQEAVRMGIPAGTPWQLNNGEAIAMPGPNPARLES